MELFLLMVAISLIPSNAVCHRILMLAPLGSWSEYQLTKIIARTLTDAGHSITVVSSFKPSTQDELIEEIYLGKSVFEDKNIFKLDLISTSTFVNDGRLAAADKMYTNKEVLQLWRKRNTFDAIIIYSAGNEIASPFLIDYTGTYIGLCAIGIENFQILNQGHRLPKSVVPFLLMSSGYHMTFWERTLSLVVETLLYNFAYIFMLPGIQQKLEEYFPGHPPVLDIYGNYSLLLINSHFGMYGPVPLLPTQVEIGTLTAREPKPLPEDLEKFMSGSSEGVIYFSLGSLAKSTDIPENYKLLFIEAFSQLTQRVVWKYEGDDLELPKNVLTRKWLSQQDILGHPATVLFISHCGMFGTQEAKYHGVPVLGVPIAFDQPRNAERLARSGYGEVLYWDDMTVDKIVKSINKIINDPRYAQNLKVVSSALKDQKDSPAERTVWWVEYAIRHRGAPHMDYAGKHLNTLQYYMIDVFCFLALVLLSWATLTYFCIKHTLRKLYRKKNKEE
ncbi:unnamed protein product [Meganyctiphanes norvegica]|uniref:Glucuronosyltransferase n=1 Tax=Meganyctiphanes norvegica TaxID=48144 RepID=A0AAV2S239_MEGNR